MGRVKAGILDIVEGAYDTDIGSHDWLARANEQFASRIPGVVACGGYVITKMASGSPTFHEAFLSGVDDAVAVFGSMHENMSPEFSEAIFPNGTSCGLFSKHWGRVQKERSWPSGILDDAERVFGLLRAGGGDDLLFAANFDHTGTGVLVGAIGKSMRLTARASDIYRRAAVHLAAGLRLRRTLARAQPNDPAEAIFEADGRLAHADGVATEVDMRARLRDAVKRIDRARTGAVRNEELEALELWRGLVEGRWSLIDRHDTDGRRYYVAMANPPEGISARQLSAMEARVVAQAAAGEPNGTIAYALGITEAAIAGHLRNAMRKLGARSRMDLVRLGRALGAA